MQRRGENVIEPVRESNSEGPLKFNFIRGPAPMVIDPEEGDSIEREFRFEISNVGQGWPITDDTVGKIGSVKIELRAPSGISLGKCEGLTTDTALLRSDGKAPASFTVRIDTSRWKTPTEGSLIFNIELKYKYFVDSEVSVSVQGSKR
jgi:hypothetical protein